MAGTLTERNEVYTFSAACHADWVASIKIFQISQKTTLLTTPLYSQIPYAFAYIQTGKPTTRKSKRHLKALKRFLKKKRCI